VKGISHLIHAFGRVVEEEPGAQLNIVGAGPLRSRLEQEVVSSGLSEKVYFLGALPQTEVRGHLHRARLLVLPSLSEGLGRVLIEAMASRLPVVASEVGGVPDLVRDGTTGFLVPPADDEALAERILWILKNEEAARRMGEEGRRFVEENFTSELYLSNYAKLLDRAQELRTPAAR
jgi:glycosyltransferase involved in cell wall biosynthesis